MGMYLLYFAFGAGVGLIFGYVVAALLSASNRALSEENLQAYCDTLENELDKARLENEKLFRALKGVEANE